MVGSMYRTLSDRHYFGIRFWNTYTRVKKIEHRRPEFCSMNHGLSCSFLHHWKCYTPQLRNP